MAARGKGLHGRSSRRMVDDRGHRRGWPADAVRQSCPGCAGGDCLMPAICKDLPLTVPIIPGFVGGVLDRADQVRMAPALLARSEEHTSELQSLMRISSAVFCLKKKKKHTQSECYV